MSRAAIRAATAAWFGGRPQPTRPSMFRDSPVQFLSTLWTSGPREAQDDDFWPLPGQISGGVATVHLVHSAEKREAFGGGGTFGIPPAGQKRIDHTVYLETYFRSRQQRVEDAIDDFDTFLDSLTQRIRADRTWGTGGRGFDEIWQAGEDVELTPGEPELKDNRLYVEVAVVTTVTEWVLS